MFLPVRNSSCSLQEIKTCVELSLSATFILTNYLNGVFKMNNDMATIGMYKADLIEITTRMYFPEELNDAILSAVDNAIDLWLFKNGYTRKEYSA